MDRFEALAVVGDNAGANNLHSSMDRFEGIKNRFESRDNYEFTFQYG